MGRQDNIKNRSQKQKDGPVVGEGVTQTSGSDCYPYTVVEVFSPTRCRVTPDECTVISGSEMHGDAEYLITPQPNQLGTIIRQNKNGQWKPAGQPKGNSYYIGHRRAYRDPHF